MSNPNKEFNMADLGAALPSAGATAALSAEDRAGLVNALKNKLQNLAGQHSDVLETLTPVVRKRVEVLREIQSRHDDLEAKFFEERAALEAKYQKLYEPLYTKRYEIVNGIVEAEGVKSENAMDQEEDKEKVIDAEKGVPDFWLTAMKTNEILAEEISERDEEALKYLKDIKWCRIDNPKGFKLEFFFDTNPFFKNTVLTKTYHMIDDDEPILEKAIGTDIEWYPGKCLTQKILKKKPRKGSKNAKPITKTENCESFFNFFSPPQVPEEDDDIEERCNALEAKEREMDFAKRELESKQKQLDDRIRGLELKEKKLANIIKIRVGADQSEGNSPSLDLGFVVTMFGNGLQLFLNEHVKYHDSIAGKVLEALKHSIDPAKLVVDAMEGFYPPHLKKGNFEFEGSVVRRSCILLLEQIMKISPTIRTDVKEAALGIAAEWKTKMKPVVENWLEVLGFLSLLAAYELGGDFDVDELLSLYKIVPQHRQTPELFVLLDFTDEIGGGGATSKQRKRSLDLSKCYDSARNAARKSRLPPKQLIQDKIPNVSTFQFGGLNDHQSTDLPDGHQSFWTCCPFCTIKSKDFVNRSLCCQNCSKHFIAYDLGAQGAPPVSNQANTGSNRGQPQVSQQKQVPTKSCKLGARSSGPFNSYHLRSVVNSSRKMGSEHVTRTSGTAEVGGGLKNNVKGIAHVNTEEGNTVDAAKTRESGTSRDGKRKRGRPPKRSHENTVEFDKKAVTLESGANKFNVIYDSESKPNFGSTSDPEFYECPDPEFSDFDKDKDEKCFSVDQIWACYDTVDGMPRFYAKVKKVLSRGFKLRITWLEADPEEQGEIDWVNEGLPVCCGKFNRGDTEETSDRLSFSHLIHFDKGIGRGSYLIYPRLGETWALFKNWEIGQSTDSENHKKYIFEIVEILSDFSNVTGIKVGYLRKMEGFVSLFQRIRLGGDAIFVIPSSETLRFSHRVPSFKMTGAESEGVPEGSFELDPSALPTNLKELWQPEEKVEAQSIAC